jgi:hypothetical protein
LPRGCHGGRVQRADQVRPTPWGQVRVAHCHGDRRVPYLTKMPSEWVRRWPKLSALEAAVSGTRQRLEALAERVPPLPPKARADASWKSSDDYVAVLKGGPQRRTRAHEALVRFAGEAFHAAGAGVSTPHPLDLLITNPMEIIVGAKAVGMRPCL